LAETLGLCSDPGMRFQGFPLGLRRPRPSSLAVLTALGSGALLGLLMHDPDAPAKGTQTGAEPPRQLALAASTVSMPQQTAPEHQLRRASPGAASPDLESAVPARTTAAVVATTAERTPLGEDEAAVHLVRAWISVAGTAPSPETLSLLWAQWAHETGRGRRMRGFNFAGIKGNGPEGDSFVAWTREVTSRPEQRTRDTFRAYSTPEGGAHDYVRLISSRYPAAWRAAVRGDVTRFVRALDLGGYFTDSDRAYSRALSSLARECRERAVPRRALEVVARGALIPGAEPTAL
jgi:hypothetical protein